MTDADIANRITRRRGRMLPVLGILFLAQQGIFFSGHPGFDRTVDHFKISAWLVNALVMLLVLAFGGGLFRSKAVRALVNDETTQVHRGKGYEAGFLAMFAICIVLYFLSLYEPLGGREAIHLILSAGIAAALVRFGMLERRADRG